MLLKYWTKNRHHSFLSLNNTIWGVLPTRTLQHLYPFQNETEIDQAQADELVNLLEKRAWWMLTDYLAKSEHSEYQCRIYLKKHSFHPSISDKCVSLCIEKGYLDDSRYAGMYIRSLLERGKSKRFIMQKLKEQRLESSLICELLTELEDKQQSRELLKEQVAKLIFKHREEDPRKAKEKIYASLFRKGFSLEEISEVWRDLKKS